MLFFISKSFYINACMGCCCGANVGLDTHFFHRDVMLKEFPINHNDNFYTLLSTLLCPSLHTYSVF